ncbi:PTS N-acetylgalactosamine transporter subunit IIB [Vibrio penaeicida]|uniref:PTS N-acetylgalactosamine transporter subunit IIB n=1 Tax=Vibrio penaeicida TaxID=104609 RepID=A0AAV5NMD2_9VIBR|nr:PTS N-acetylgalactosamine transporter subunit IIB [Vibrio penaeicida]RTZ19805.1 PTS N-acetylgalactosamine transporter subunit IIB [Vibrio penaeicida]GLQ71781.1 PTS N-acetylgalactosamine transporter subunit IIB [Vibrio penaeicida]
MGINLTRVDNRLLHGQVAVAWSHHAKANLIVIANDDVAEDAVQQNLMTMSAGNMGVRFFSIQKTIDVIHKASPEQHIILVVRTPQDVVRLVEGGLPLDDINIGNMHYSEGKKQIHVTVSVDNDDMTAFKRLKELGVHFAVQRMPHEEKLDIFELYEAYKG